MKISSLYRKSVLGLVVPVALLTGCSSPSFRPMEKMEHENGIAINSSASDAQSTYVKSSLTDARFCTETDTDFSKTSASGFDLGIGTGASTESVGEKSSQGAVTLGGRDPAVLLARELMYRACELTLNINADQMLALKIYEGTLDAVIRISASQQNTGTGSVVASDDVDIDAGGDKKKIEDPVVPVLKPDSPTVNPKPKKDDPPFDWSLSDYKTPTPDSIANHP